MYKEEREAKKTQTHTHTTTIQQTQIHISMRCTNLKIRLARFSNVARTGTTAQWCFLSCCSSYSYGSTFSLLFFLLTLTRTAHLYLFANVLYVSHAHTHTHTDRSTNSFAAVLCCCLFWQWNMIEFNQKIWNSVNSRHRYRILMAKIRFGSVDLRCSLLPMQINI